MFKFLVAIFVIYIASSNAFPQQAKSAAAAAPGVDASATVVSNSFADDGAGNFLYNYETSNQIKADATGQLKQLKDGNGTDIKAEVQTGQFSFLAPDGNTYQVKWIADENGFQPQGDHIPKAPAA